MTCSHKAKAPALVRGGFAKTVSSAFTGTPDYSVAIFNAAAQASATSAWSTEQLDYIEQTLMSAYIALAAEFHELGQRMLQAEYAVHPDAVARAAAKCLRQHVLPLLDALESVGEAARERRFDLQEVANDDDGGDYAA